MLIAYVLPGFVALWSLRGFSATIDAWLAVSPTIPAGLESLVFVLLASITAGMTLSAVRWAVIDTLHHCTGLPRPAWDDANLPAREHAFDTVVEAHYRYYQFYANSSVALAMLYGAQWCKLSGPPLPVTVVFVAVEILFLATSRDNLRKYYGRTARLLGALSPAEKERPHVQWQSPKSVSASGQARKGDTQRYDRIENQMNRP